MIYMKATNRFRIALMAMLPLAGLCTMAQDQKTDEKKNEDTKVVKEPKIVEKSIVDEVIWVVGDEAILKSDVEEARLQAEQEGTRWNGDPDCVIPEQIAVQKLFLHQAAIDSIEVTESEIMQEVEAQINYWTQMVGSKEKLEEYKKQSIAQMRNELHDTMRDRKMAEEMRKELVKDIAVTPAEVRRFFKDLPEDSIPYVPTEVEVQIITQTPKIEQEEINRVKDQLREFTDRVTKGEKIGLVRGDIRVLLSGERTALNFLQRMSGIATYTRNIADLLEGSKTKLLDTRKTTPNMRIFEKYAVKVGGGYNHRYNLSDGILLKDNHIGAAGGVKEAVRMAKEYAPFVRKIETEVENLDMLKEALEAGADIIMLDNMSVEDMKEAVRLAAGKAETECSGIVTRENVARLVDIGVDYISSGALTHSSPILDLSLKNLHAV